MSRKNNNIIIMATVTIIVIISVVLAIVFVMGSDKKGSVPENNVPDKNTEITEQPEENSENSPEQQIPEVQEPVIEEPVIEEPIIDEPIIDEPAEIEPQPEIPEVQEPDISDVDGEWNLVLANPWNKLPEDYTVQLADIAGGHRVDARIVDDLDAMMKDMAKDGCSAFVCSSYRTHSKQTTLYNNEVADYLARGYSEEDAAVEAAKWVAIPGTSEHQTGLAVDIMSNYYLVLDEGQEDTAEQKWLMENSYKYGFILRYPNNKSEITGINYEPWHYRYVGKEAAKEIYERGICFEEYLAG